MELNTSIYASLTDTEMSELSQSAYRAVRKLYEAASCIFDMLARTSIHDAIYGLKQREAAVLMSAAREQDQLHSEVCEEIHARHIARQAARYPVTRPLPARDTSGDMTTDEVREFEANWAAE